MNVAYTLNFDSLKRSRELYHITSICCHLPTHRCHQSRVPDDLSVHGDEYVQGSCDSNPQMSNLDVCRVIFQWVSDSIEAE